jgi:hypothetical protein
MAGRLINGEKYVGLMNDHSFKSKSLEDNIYFTLRDIFWNGNVDDCMQANGFNGVLTNNICFEDRTEHFAYSTILHDANSNFAARLLAWLSYFARHEMFDFELPDDDDGEINMSTYIKYDSWREHVAELVVSLKKHTETTAQQ